MSTSGFKISSWKDIAVREWKKAGDLKRFFIKSVSSYSSLIYSLYSIKEMVFNVYIENKLWFLYKFYVTIHI